MDASLEKLLRDRGHRITRPRRAVLQALSDGPAHMTAAQVLALGRYAYRPLSRASVYRTLELMEEAGTLRAIPAPEGRRYVRVSHGHHHLVCRSCGEVQDFASCGLCESWALTAQAQGFRVAGHLLEVFGECRDCQQGA